MIKYVSLIMFFMLVQIILLAQKDLIIKGKVINNADYAKVSLENIVTQSEIDTALIDKSGAFQLKTMIDRADFYKLKFSDQHYILLVLNPGEIVNVEVDLNNLYFPVINGSKHSELVYSTYGKMKEFDEELQKATQQIEIKKKEYLRQFVINNMTSLSSLFFIENLDMEADIEIFRKLDENLMKLYPDNFLVKNLHDKLKGSINLGTGTLAPEIDLPGVDGKNVKLSSLRGKYVLIDFWAAWCGPCRKESPNMVAVYEKYNSKGFTIYSVSLDQKKEDWTNAIKKDGLGKWTHVSDLKYWSSQAARDYNVDGIPFTVLVDKEGKILAKGLRGEDLNAKLEEIFN